ncbi:MAG: hypothetical protein IIX36_01090, partial [Clostridia bacterium]|nr:hypothetical protein [Clostridia bacterium]
LSAGAESEIKFALTFAKQIFHTLQRISSRSDFTRCKANFIKKSTAYAMLFSGMSVINGLKINQCEALYVIRRRRNVIIL